MATRASLLSIDAMVATSATSLRTAKSARSPLTTSRARTVTLVIKSARRQAVRRLLGCTVASSKIFGKLDGDKDFAGVAALHFSMVFFRFGDGPRVHRTVRWRASAEKLTAG